MINYAKKAIQILKYLMNSIKIRNTIADHISDYDIACQTYDEYYSRHLGKKTLEMLDAIPIVEDGHYIDIPCGTGFLTVPLAQKLGPNGKIIAVDLSAGMLGKCRENVEKSKLNGKNNISFENKDAFGYLQTLPDASVDGVICAWGICYVKHNLFIKEIERVLKPGGVAAIIENKADTLKEINDIYVSILIDYPTALQKKLRLDLPKNSNVFRKFYKKNNLKNIQSWDGDVEIPCKNGLEVYEYLQKSGAISGFINALDKDFEAELTDLLIKKIDKDFSQDNPLKVIHRFSCAIATKE